MSSFPVAVHGLSLDPETRCLHWHSPRDIIAIKMACCGLYYACKDCHDALAGHPLKPWPRSQWNTLVILCGTCKTELTIDAYLACNNHCPHCNAAFNPGCRNHYHYYFAIRTVSSASAEPASSQAAGQAALTPECAR